MRIFAPSIRAIRAVWAFTGLTLVTALAACSSWDGGSGRLLDAITPYKLEVVQGNFVSKEQVEALKPGMPRTQVQSVLGTPLLTSLFRQDRWDYIFTLKREGVEPQSRRLTVYFKGDALERFEGDAMPSEKEFVAKLEANRKLGAIPNLDASAQDLKAYAPKAVVKPETTPSAPLPDSYPPLEAKP